MLVLACVICEGKGNVEPPCQDPGRRLRTALWSSAAAFSVVRALAVSFVPASCLDICWYLHRMLKRNGYREKSAACSHLGSELEGSGESRGCFLP